MNVEIELAEGDIDRIAQKVAELLRPIITNPSQTDDTVFTVEGLAKYLETTPKWCYGHLRAIPHFKVDGLLRFKKRIIDRFFEGHPEKCPHK